jgi:glyoxylase-like metal-dependent hydrolase (beta-lactamase superfamily II)
MRYPSYNFDIWENDTHAGAVFPPTDPAKRRTMKTDNYSRNNPAGPTKGTDVRTVALSATNCYLLPCAGGYLQIDCGFPGEYEAYTQKLGRLGIEPSEIRYLLLTHHHDDHAGFAAELLEKTGARLIVQQRSLPFLARGVFEGKGRPLNLRIRLLMGMFSFLKKRGCPPVFPRATDHVVAGDDHELLRSIGIDGDILYTPGHTTDSMSVVLSGGDTFVGGAAMNFLKACAIHYHPIFITDIGEVYAGWERIRGQGGTTIYPAHGKPFNAVRLVPDERLMKGSVQGIGTHKRGA